MKIIGLLGGMSWESTAPYYRYINESIKERLGGYHSAKVILYSVDFDEVERLQQSGNWEAAGSLLAQAARAIESAGADCLLLCTNTMHKVTPAIEAAVCIPLLHIVDATAQQIKSTGLSKIGLLGTRFTMEEAFYTDRLNARHGLSVLIPDEQDREIIHRVIYEELCRGQVVNKSRTEYCRVMADLVRRGAEGIILGCTEISILVGADDSSVPLFDTTRIHACKAVEWALS